MEALIKALSSDYPQLQFQEAEVALWSPQLQTVSYVSSSGSSSLFAVLHEVGHALLGHESYDSDNELLQKEIDAWQKGSQIAKHYGITIDQGHVQNCLDTYRDWVHKRSSCPNCDRHGLQQSKALYRCINCQGTWKVSPSRFCRPYRLTKAVV